MPFEGSVLFLVPEFKSHRNLPRSCHRSTPIYISGVSRHFLADQKVAPRFEAGMYSKYLSRKSIFPGTESVHRRLNL